MHFVDPVLARPLKARDLKFSLENATPAVGISECSSWMFTLKKTKQFYSNCCKIKNTSHKTAARIVNM